MLGARVGVEGSKGIPLAGVAHVAIMSDMTDGSVPASAVTKSLEGMVSPGASVEMSMMLLTLEDAVTTSAVG